MVCMERRSTVDLEHLCTCLLSVSDGQTSLSSYTEQVLWLVTQETNRSRQLQCDFHIAACSPGGGRQVYLLSAPTLDAWSKTSGSLTSCVSAISQLTVLGALLRTIKSLHGH